MDDEKLRRLLRNYPLKSVGSSKYFAVLVPLIEIDGRDHILYEIRGRHITQPGEISFPGGRIEEGESKKQAAIRETMEELNLTRGHIEILGEFDFISNNPMIIYSFIGRIKHISIDQIEPNEEVERLLTVPVDYFLNHRPKFYKMREHVTADEDFPFDLLEGGRDYQFRKTNRTVPFYNIPGENLWGFTAQITHSFSQFLNKKNSED